MGLAAYDVVANGSQWSVSHDGDLEGTYETKEGAFESAVAAASLAIRQGHAVRVTSPGNDAGNMTAIGGKTN